MLTATPARPRLMFVEPGARLDAADVDEPGRSSGLRAAMVLHRSRRGLGSAGRSRTQRLPVCGWCRSAGESCGRMPPAAVLIPVLRYIWRDL